jgi:hypothetical protein
LISERGWGGGEGSGMAHGAAATILAGWRAVYFVDSSRLWFSRGRRAGDDLTSLRSSLLPLFSLNLHFHTSRIHFSTTQHAHRTPTTTHHLSLSRRMASSSFSFALLRIFLLPSLHLSSTTDGQEQESMDSAAAQRSLRPRSKCRQFPLDLPFLPRRSLLPRRFRRSFGLQAT